MNQVHAPSIVLFDTDGQSRARAAHALGTLGFEVVLAGDVRSAARLTRIETAQLALVELGEAILENVPRWQRRRDDRDLPLAPPIEQGYALLRPLRLAPQAARFPVVILRDDDEDPAGPQRFAVVGYVPRAFEAGWLSRAVDEALALDPVPETARAEVVPQASDGAATPAFELLHKALRTALIVDSDSRFRQWLRGVMALHGFRVHEAGSGEEGLRVAVAARPWLILAEVTLPGAIDGFELCRRIRNRALTGHTPLILLSGRDEYQDRYQGLSAGADDFLSKHATTREILIRVQLVLKRYADLGARTVRGAGVEGRLDLIGAPGLLQMCHLGQLWGVLTVRTEGQAAEFHFREGEIVKARSGGLSGATAVYEFLAWKSGRFEFVPGEPLESVPLADGFDRLLLEGCRLLDERARAETPGAVLQPAN